MSDVLSSFVGGQWRQGEESAARPFFDSSRSEVLGTVSSEGLNFAEMLAYAREVGNPRLRAMTFQSRARLLKSLAEYLNERKQELYDLSFKTGATRFDAWFDVDGGIGTFFVYSSRGRRELPDASVLCEGPYEPLSRGGTFVGQHILVPLRGVALHINAFNFPVWGMMEKLAPNILAGMPAIVKPASATAFVTRRAVEMMLESGILPEGSLQLVCGGLGDTFDRLTSQDVVTFTGSAETALKLRSHTTILAKNVRFNIEADSLNSSILGDDVQEDDPEFSLFVKEVAREMTVKAGQKCTAVRRIFVPHERMGSVRNALVAELEKVRIGDPTDKATKMGPLVSLDQLRDLREKLVLLEQESKLVFGGVQEVPDLSEEFKEGAFCPFALFEVEDVQQAKLVHEVEAFGPVATLIPYRSRSEVIELVSRGGGSLVSSIFSHSSSVFRELALGIASDHGRLLLVNRHCAGESTGHGSPLPHLVHGGPGRAGGGQEMGGLRGLHLYMQRTALQGSPETLTQIGGEWITGAEEIYTSIHPFRRYFDELEIGETLLTHRRTVTEADISQFAGISGDFFYAHVDDIAARKSLFEKRVAHGYFLVSAAAGLFVHPAEGPVLANYGLNNLRFIKPVYIGDTIHVKLTCQRKMRKEPKQEERPHGVVEWAVEIRNQDDDIVALYSILTLVAERSGPGKKGFDS